MAKPSTPSRAPRNAPQRKSHCYIDALFADDFGRQSKLTISSANSFARKKVDTAAQSLQLKSERQEKKARLVEIREWRAAMRSLDAELRESDRRTRSFWRQLKTRIRPETKLEHRPPKARQRDWPHAAVALPKYDGPVIDRHGQRGVFMRVRYYSRRTAEAGVSQRVIAYCFHGAELARDGNPYVATNIAETIDEALCGFDHLEQINWAAQKNAKLLMHGIMAVDHRQSPDEMMTCGVRWAEETLGRFDLPYLVTLHAPPPDGDQRNWHLHILWSFRPMVRTGDHEWQVGEMLRTDLDNPKAMKAFREMFAGVMTEMSFEAGQKQIWTAKSNADRGLPHEPQTHLGAAKTNRARSGEHVAENEENHERVMRSKAAVIDDTLRHADAALAKAQNAARAIASRFVLVPALPMPVPERVAVSTMTLEAPAFGPALPLSKTSIMPPAMPPARIVSDGVAVVIEPRERNIPQRSSAEVVTLATPQTAARPAAIEIANLRIRPLRMAKPVVALPPHMPTALVRPSAPAIPPVVEVAPPRLAETPHHDIKKPILAQPTLLQLPAFPPSWTPLSLADTGNLDRVVARVRDALKNDDERRRLDDETITRIAREARAVAARDAADRQLREAVPAASKPRSSGWHAALSLRQKARADWGETEWRIDAGLTRPGIAVPKPRVERLSDQASPAPRVAVWPGRGMDD